MTKEDLPLRLWRSLLSTALRLTKFVIALDVDLRSFRKALQIVEGIGVETEDTMPARSGRRTGLRRGKISAAQKASGKILHAQPSGLGGGGG